MKVLTIEFKIEMFDNLVSPPFLFKTFKKDDWTEAMDKIKELKDANPQLTQHRAPYLYNIIMTVTAIEKIDCREMTMLEEYRNPLPF